MTVRFGQPVADDSLVAVSKDAFHRSAEPVQVLAASKALCPSGVQRTCSNSEGTCTPSTP